VADRVVVVGAGITGLSCAASLAGDADVVVFDRIPVPGGVHGWEQPETERLVATCGAELRLGVTAMRWDGRELLVAGQDGPERVAAAALVVATGTRPLGRAELRIAGGRPAGILPAPAACHLAENGLLAGRRPAIVGGGDWALRATHELLTSGASRVTLLAPDGVRRERPADRRVDVREGARPVLVEGAARVERVTLASGETVECDGLVLAHGLVPLRNIDGAVWDAAGVVFAQPLADPATVPRAERAGADAAESVRSFLKRRETR
jgi:D-hydroxyproline dehydrogenase subunit alpha